MATNITDTDTTNPDVFSNITVTPVALNLLDSLNNQTHQSEDCLTVNVWTKPQVGEAKKAVMVWIHGGAYTAGMSSQTSQALASGLTIVYRRLKHPMVQRTVSRREGGCYCCVAEVTISTLSSIYRCTRVQDPADLLDHSAIACRSSDSQEIPPAHPILDS